MTHHSLTPRRLVDMEEYKKKETRLRRMFDREFKNDAARLVELSNRSVKQVAKELDIFKKPPCPTRCLRLTKPNEQEVALILSSSSPTFPRRTRRS
jgi:hypothetical protein